MEKNYYQILEVDKNASEEVIDKAYKTLAKKYHPDLQNEENHLYEEKMKAINEAYSILSDDFKRANYDAQLQEDTISPEQYHEIIAENIELKRQIERLTNSYQTVNNAQYRVQQNRVENQSTYVRRQRDFKKYKNIIKEYRNVIIGVVIGIIILILISQIPFIKKYLIQLYQENVIIKAIVDIFVKTFTTEF